MKKKTFSKRLLALALSVMMCLALAIPVMAEPEIEVVPTTYATAAITKQLTMAEGTNIPAKTFTCKFVKVGYSSDVTVDPATSNTTSVPTIADQSVTYTAGSSAAYTADSNGLIHVGLETPDFISTVDWNATGVAPGVYEYMIYEADESIANTNTDIYSYSAAQYRVRIYVYYDALNDKNYVSYVNGTVESVTTPGTPGTPGTDKVPGTPGTDGSEEFEWTEDEGNHSGFNFKNTFVKKTDGDPDPANPDPDASALVVSKTVTGAGGDYTKEFPVKIDLTKIALEAEDTTYNAYLWNEDGTPALNASGNQIIVVVTLGTVANVTLKHGQFYTFPCVPVGTNCHVSVRAVEYLRG